MFPTAFERGEVGLGVFPTAFERGEAGLGIFSATFERDEVGSRVFPTAFERGVAGLGIFSMTFERGVAGLGIFPAAAFFTASAGSIAIRVDRAAFISWRILGDVLLKIISNHSASSSGAGLAPASRR